VPDRPNRAILIVVSAPSLQLFGRVRKGQEPVGAQALGPEGSIEGFDVGIIRHDVTGATIQRIGQVG